MEPWWRDIRIAARSLARTRTFTLTAVVTLALGIAANTAVFSLAYGTLLRPLPFTDPGRLVVVYRTAAEAGRGTLHRRWSYPRLQALRRSARSLEPIAAFGRSDWNLGGDGADPERVPGEPVSASYFAALGTTPVLGRVFSPEEDSTPGTHPVALVSHALWLRRFGGDSAILGRAIRVNQELLTVVGVMPPRFGGLTGRAELWVPQMMAPRVSYANHLTTDQNFISVVARLRPGVTLAQARAELAGLGARIAAELPDEVDVPTTWGATAVPLAEARIDPAQRRSVLFLFGAVAFLLVLACANLAGLGLARAAGRRQEIAVRVALGAGRGRLIRSLLTENALLGLAGGGIGTILALGIIQVLRAPTRAPGPGNMYGALGEFAAARMDLVVLGFTALASLAAIILSGLAPAVQATRADLAAELRDRTAGTGTRSRGGARVQAGLVVLEIALALVLSVGAGLLLASLRRLETHPLGVDPHRVLTFRIMPSEVRYGTAEAPLLIDRVVEAVAAIPGVRSVTVDACAPLGHCASSTLYVAGRPEPPPGQAPFVLRHYVGWDHFTTLGIPLLKGRAFSPQDRAGRGKVTIINETAARRFWPGEDPIGRRVWFGSGSAFAGPDSAAEIVNIVGDVPYGSLERGPPPSFYTPYRQFTYPFRTVLLKTAGDPEAYAQAVRRAVGTVDDLPIFDARPLTDLLADARAPTRFNATLMVAFAVLSVLLAAGGVYGVVAHSVSTRMRELGIRAALGATQGRLLRLVLGQGLGLAAVGVGLGVAAALSLGRLARALLFQVSETDPLILGTQAAVLLGVALLASYRPARRATRADPVAALRAD
jgi:putative ABC transport system permease protein